MAANQIPLLALGDDDGSPTTKAMIDKQEAEPGVFPPDPIDALAIRKARRLQAANAQSESPPVVAFSDPDDLLSYPTRPYFQQLDRPRSYELIDAIVSNAPTLLTLIENPYTAHTGYGDTKAVLSLLVCGRRWARLC